MTVIVSGLFGWQSLKIFYLPICSPSFRVGCRQINWVMRRNELEYPNTLVLSYKEQKIYHLDWFYSPDVSSVMSRCRSRCAWVGKINSLSCHQVFTRLMKVAEDSFWNTRIHFSWKMSGARASRFRKTVGLCDPLISSFAALSQLLGSGST